MRARCLGVHARRLLSVAPPKVKINRLPRSNSHSYTMQQQRGRHFHWGGWNLNPKNKFKDLARSSYSTYVDLLFLKSTQHILPYSKEEAFASITEDRRKESKAFICFFHHIMYFPLCFTKET